MAKRTCDYTLEWLDKTTALFEENRGRRRKYVVAFSKGKYTCKNTQGRVLKRSYKAASHIDALSRCVS